MLFLGLLSGFCAFEVGGPKEPSDRAIILTQAGAATGCHMGGVSV